MSFGQRKLDREKPEIDFPEGDAPTELVIQDLIEGKGAEVVPGSRVLAHYVGVAFSTGEEFDASWNRGEPLPFQVGVGLENLKLRGCCRNLRVRIQQP